MPATKQRPALRRGGVRTKTKTANAKNDKSLIFRGELIDRLGLSYSTIWAMMRRGEFPSPLELSDGIVCWPSREVDRWIQSRPRRVYATKTRG